MWVNFRPLKTDLRAPKVIKNMHYMSRMPAPIVIAPVSAATEGGHDDDVAHNADDGNLESIV
jgi:hypothetical protein